MVAVPTRDRNASQHRAEHPDNLAELRDLFWQEAQLAEAFRELREAADPDR